MDVKDKIVNVLSQVLKPEYLRLADEEGPDDGIAGYIVSRAFEGMSALARQTKIDEILANASLSQEERRRVLLIAGLTPEEFKAVGVPIRIDKIKELAGGAVEVVLHGQLSDAEYVRDTLRHQKGVQTTGPKPVSGASGILMSFRVYGTESNPLTKEKVIRVLKKNSHIEL